jgi:hypothetical protein
VKPEAANALPVTRHGSCSAAGTGNQDKHHRWSLDESQIYQYHLGAALHPHIRWYEAMHTPRQSVQFMEVGTGTLTANVICEDLTQNDEVAEVIRAVGPTFMSAFLLDGPQLATRWGARYAGVLVDDPGTAILTLTSYGMVRRSRTRRHDASAVIALWKDSDGGAREIPLDPGAHGVVLTVCGDVATRRSADGRWPADTGTRVFDVATHQVHATVTRAVSSNVRSPTTPAPPALNVDELAILTGWAEAVAEALSDPPPRVTQALDAIDRALSTSIPPDGILTFEAGLAATERLRPDEPDLDRLARRVLRSRLDQVRSRHQRATLARRSTKASLRREQPQRPDVTAQTPGL